MSSRPSVSCRSSARSVRAHEESEVVEELEHGGLEREVEAAIEADEVKKRVETHIGAGRAVCRLHGKHRFGSPATAQLKMRSATACAA